MHWSHDCAAQIDKAVVPTGSVNGGSVAEDVEVVGVAEDVEVVEVVAVVGFGTVGVGQRNPAGLPAQEHVIPHEGDQKVLPCEQHSAEFGMATCSQQAAGGCGVTHDWVNGHLQVQEFLVKLDAPLQHSSIMGVTKGQVVSHDGIGEGQSTKKLLQEQAQ